MGATQDKLALALQQAKDSVSNVDKDPAVLRKEVSEREAAAIVDWLKEVIGAGVTVPQDGGTSLKTTILAKLNN